jgi:hypothetical protein
VAALTPTLADRLRFVVLVALIGALIAASFIMGIGRRMDHKIAFGPMDDGWHLSVAISRNVYGLEGYVGFYKVLLTLQQSLGLVDWGLQASIPALSDEALLNEAIKKAASLDDLHGLGPTFPRTLEAYRDGVGVVGSNLMAPIGEDLGESDFYATAFRLFGMRIESAYYFFYLLLCITVLAYLLEFRNSPTALALLLFNVFAFHVFFHIPFFSIYVPTVYEGRFGSVLSIIPSCHFGFLLIERRALRPVRLAIAVVQAAILLFGIFIRSSANWDLLALVLLFLLLLAGAMRVAHGAPLWTRLRMALNVVRVWPLAVVLCGAVILSTYIATVPNPIFQTEANPPHHMRWHALWIGLSFHPDWHKYFPDLPVGNDNTAQLMTVKLWIDSGHRAEDFNSPYTRAMDIGLHERLVREQYLKFIRAHPIYLLQSIFYYKPILFYQTLWDLYAAADLSVAIPLIAVLLTGVLLGMRWSAPEFRPSTAVGVAVLAFICSVLPIMLAYPALHAVMDEVWTATALGTASVVAMLCAAARLAGRVLGSVAPAPMNNDGARSPKLAMAVGSVVLALIGVLLARAAAPGVNFIDANYDLCASDVRDVQRVAVRDARISFSNVGGTLCDGRLRCAFHAQRANWLPDETDESCKRKLRISWQCGRSGRVKETEIPVDINDGYDALLACR